MVDYRKIYSVLFNAISDALDRIESKDYAVATEILMQAQLEAEEIYGNTAQYVCGICRIKCALILSLFLEIHKVFLQKSAFIRTHFLSASALAALCGIALCLRGG